MSLTTVRDEYTLKCVEATDMTELMKHNVEGLRRLSEYAIVQQDINKQGESQLEVITFTLKLLAC